MMAFVKIELFDPIGIIHLKTDISSWLNIDAAPYKSRGLILEPNGFSWDGRVALVDFYDETTMVLFQLHFAGQVKVT